MTTPADLDAFLRLAGRKIVPLKNGRGDDLVCPKCKSERIVYRDLGSVGRHVCLDCAWIDWNGNGPEARPVPTVVDRALALLK